MKSNRMIESAVVSAVAGRNVFYVSPDDVARERHVEQAIEHAVNIGGRLVRSDAPGLLRAGTGTLQFYTLRVVDGFHVRPSLRPRDNDDKHFHTITLGIHEPRLIIDHHADYLIDLSRRRRAAQTGAQQ